MRGNRKYSERLSKSLFAEVTRNHRHFVIYRKYGISPPPMLLLQYMNILDRIMLIGCFDVRFGEAGGDAMTMQVVYHDNTHDMISAFTIDPLIKSNKIKMFYRPSEDRWITVGVDSVRENSQELGHFDGYERRLANIIAAQLV